MSEQETETNTVTNSGKTPGAGRAMIYLMVTGVLLGGAFIAGRETLPFGISMPAFTVDGARVDVDPRSVVEVEGIGYGTRLVSAELRDESGKVLAQVADQTEFHPDVALEFGKRYTIAATAERLWLNQRESRETSFTTVSLPKVESNLRQELAPDASVTLRFSEPVGKVTVNSDIKLDLQPDASNRTFKLVAAPDSYTQGSNYAVNIDWQTRTGVPLQPLKMEISTAPALTATVPINGMKNLGLAMPIQIDFSEPLRDRAQASEAVSVRTEAGDEIGGKWLWFGKQRVQFSPQPGWPASTTITVSVDPANLKTARGGFLVKPVSASFATGPDKRIQVILDKQRVEILENGEVVKTLRASTGKAKTPTVTGNFYIYARFPTKTMKSTGLKPGQKGYYEVKDVPYAQYFHEGYAFHGAFWHNNFGRPASHGCVNLATRKKNGRRGINEDAGWLYQWATLGVPVSVHRTTPPKEHVVTTQIEPENANPEKDDIDLPASN
jgi:lipoprotein-anchoring transpeptidase ErfK/SrfK